MKTQAAQSAERSALQPQAAPRARLPLGLAVLVIAGLSGALWLGIVRLLGALF